MPNWSMTQDVLNGRTAGRLAIASSLLVLSCTGSIGGTLGSGDGTDNGGGGQGAGQGPGPGPGTGTGGDSAGGNSGGIASVPPANCTPATVLPSPLRRLSHSEYQATLRDLFPGMDIGRPALLKDATTLPGGGFENRALLLSASPLLVENYSDAASDIAIKAITNAAVLKSILPCAGSAGNEDACGAQFIASFGAKAFRRPLTTEEQASFVAFFNAERPMSNFNGAVQLTIEAMLESPQLLYRFEIGQGTDAGRVPLTQQEVATRLSYMFTGSMPDAELAAAATAGELKTAQQREAQARRLLSDARAGTMMVDFHRQWLEMDRLNTPDAAKDPKTYPTYDATLQAAVREESDRFVKQVMFAGPGSVTALLTSSDTEVNKPLADLYGVPAPASGWQKVTLDPGQRAGFLTRANFLAARSRKVAGSPPLRASFILQRFFCMTPPEPPADADLSEPAAKPSGTATTNRQLFEERLKVGAACQNCHNTFSPMGYALEHYDAIGRYRATDAGLPVDATGEVTFGDATGPIDGGIELSRKLAENTQVQQCAVGEWYQFALGRDLDTVDECRLKNAEAAVTAAGGDMRETLVMLAASPEFGFRAIPK